MTACRRGSGGGSEWVFVSLVAAEMERLPDICGFSVFFAMVRLRHRPLDLRKRKEQLPLVKVARPQHINLLLPSEIRHLIDTVKGVDKVAGDIAEDGLFDVGSAKMIVQIKGGVIIFYNYSISNGVKSAFHEFFRDRPEPVLPGMGSQCLVVTT